MSDFLHNLRTGNIKRFDRPRKNYDNPQYRHPHDRQHHKDRKGNYQKKAHTGEQLQEIKKYIEGMAKTVEASFKVQEKAAAALERIATALEASTGINSVVAATATSAVQSQSATESATKPDDRDTAATVPSKEVLLAMINEMRAEGASFEKIAGELEQRQVATISGRGKWRGPAVSKLLKENA